MRILIAAVFLTGATALAQPVPIDGLRVVDGDTVSVGGISTGHGMTAPQKLIAHGPADLAAVRLLQPRSNFRVRHLND
jgi:hypothetical protein